MADPGQHQPRRPDDYFYGFGAVSKIENSSGI